MRKSVVMRCVEYENVMTRHVATKERVRSTPESAILYERDNEYVRGTSALKARGNNRP